ncbi:hypothetical protein HB667_09015 [Bacillus cereus]|nr:hypothetical protein [Bacillus cereus]NIL09424.1 hypothetical protein [Bacillus cereus]NKW74005.1 hypothetical protein [Bacillus cereus]HDR6478372.1 hypothetical protein [Bacillus cereus]HDR8134708.1 hypothetical protein [Bacillus cereus]
MAHSLFILYTRIGYLLIATQTSRYNFHKSNFKLSRTVKNLFLHFSLLNNHPNPYIYGKI